MSSFQMWYCKNVYSHSRTTLSRVYLWPFGRFIFILIFFSLFGFWFFCFRWNLTIYVCLIPFRVCQMCAAIKTGSTNFFLSVVVCLSLYIYFLLKWLVDSLKSAAFHLRSKIIKLSDWISLVAPVDFGPSIDRSVPQSIQYTILFK